MELNREQIAKALETLDKLDFFQGQRAGRELWFDKPFEVQEQDITDFSKGIEFVKNVITDALALIRELTEENERLEDNLIKQSTENIMLLLDKQDIKADTVRMMQERLKEKRVKPEFPWDDFFITETDIDQVAKELLEEAK